MAVKHTQQELFIKALKVAALAVALILKTTLDTGFLQIRTLPVIKMAVKTS